MPTSAELAPRARKDVSFAEGPADGGRSFGPSAPISLVQQSRHFRQRLPTLLCLLLIASCGGEDLVLPDEGIPTSIIVVDGNAQSGTIGTELAEPVVVRVLDVQGRPVQGQQVTFTVIIGGGSVDPATPTTNANGEASSSWTLGPSAGAQQLRARATGGAAPADLSVAINATAAASAATAIDAISGGGQSATAGSTLPDSLIVRVTDAAQNPVAGTAVTWTVTGGGSVSEASTVTGADGRTGVRRTLGTTAGPQTTVATVNGLTGSPVVFPATATVGTAGRLVVTTQPSATAASGAPFAQQPRVQIQDANGNNVAAVGRAITAELVSGPPGSSLMGTPTVATNAGGLAVFTNLGITGPAGSYTLNFTGANLTGATSNPVTLTAGAATRVAFTVQPANTTAGSAITPAVRVAIQDALGQTVTSASNAVTISIGRNTGGGSLSGTATVNAVNGVATFSDLAIDRAGTGYTLIASAGGLAGATSASFNISAGPAAAIAAANSMPATTVAGGTVSPAPAVRVTDASGNPVAGVNVTFAVAGGAANGSVSGGTQTTNAAGIAAVGSWTIGTGAGTQYSVTATAAGLSGSPVTFSTTATAGTAGKLAITVQPATSGASGVPLAPQPQVRLLDANDNPVLQPGIPITATIFSGPGGSVNGATVNTNASGIAVFSALAIVGPSGEYVLNFAGTNISAVTSDPVTIGAGAATKIAIISGPPSAVAIGEEFSVQVQLQDVAGNPVGTPGVTINAILQPAGGATLNGDPAVETNSSGVSTFTFDITGNLTSRTILFATSGLPTLLSSSIQVTPGAVSATQSTIARSPSVITASSPGVGGSTITVTAKDQSGNPIPDLPVVLLPVSGAGSFSAVAPTGVNGVSTATYTSTAAGAKTIGAEIDGTTIAQTVGITVNAAAATGANSTLSVSPGTITVNGAGATATITARDPFGNPVPGADITVAVTNGLASPSSGQTNGSGVFTSTITSGTAGTQTVSATVEGDALPGQSLEVTAIPTMTSVGTSGSPSLLGSTVTFTATVSGTPQPGGSVSFYVGGTCASPGSSLGSDVLSSGVASVTTTALPLGAHEIIACYPGNAIFAASSGSVAQTVNEPANQAPTAPNHAFDAIEDQVLTVPAPGVRAGAADADGTIAGAAVATGPAHGTLDLETDGSFTYSPSADYSGPDAFTYYVIDDDGAQSGAATVTLTVAAVNDSPGFTAGTPPSVSSGDGPQSIPGWAATISAGPGESQSVSFDVTTDNDAAFAVLPAIAPDGTLTFTPAAIVEATAVTVTIVARDDGGTAAGGMDESAPVQVVFTINP